MTGNIPLKLISMSEINAEEVQWLWYPYIPLGKLTILQGDPGEGKTSFILAVLAALTRGEPLPECEQAAEPMNVIYQTAEDGLADTIKPRLESAGADCTRVLVIDEGKRELTLCDARLEEAIRRTGAKLIVLDPLQAYLGSNVDIHRANEVRPVLKRLFFSQKRNSLNARLILEKYGIFWDVNKPVYSLTKLQQYILRIVKAVYLGAEYLILSDVVRLHYDADFSLLRDLVRTLLEHQISILLTDSYQNPLFICSDACRILRFEGGMFVRLLNGQEDQYIYDSYRSYDSSAYARADNLFEFDQEGNCYQKLDHQNHR